MTEPHLRIKIDSSDMTAVIQSAAAKLAVAGHRYARRSFWRGMIIGASIAGALALAAHAFASDAPSFRLQLKANNAAELKLVDELEAALTKESNAVASARADTAAIKQAADTLKAERDSNARIAVKSIEKEKKSAAFEARMYAWDGGGAIWWGLTRWALHIALALGALAGVLTVLSIFFPPVGLILGTIGRNLLSLAVRRVV